jgi:hypothetical protein
LYVEDALTVCSHNQVGAEDGSVGKSDGYIVLVDIFHICTECDLNTLGDGGIIKQLLVVCSVDEPIAISG